MKPAARQAARKEEQLVLVLDGIRSGEIKIRGTTKKASIARLEDRLAELRETGRDRVRYGPRRR